MTAFPPFSPVSSNELEPFHVDKIGELSTATALPSDQVVAPDPPGTASRIGVLTELTPKLLPLRIDEILRLAHVPSTKRPACQAELQHVVRERPAGKAAEPMGTGRDRIDSQGA